MVVPWGLFFLATPREWCVGRVAKAATLEFYSPEQCVFLGWWRIMAELTRS